MKAAIVVGLIVGAVCWLPGLLVEIALKRWGWKP